MTRPGPRSSPAAWAPGRGRILAGRYRLEAPVGSGGMATVWRAHHLALGQPVAIKFVEVTGMAAAKVRERFLREARVAAAIRHRNIVHILDFGTSTDGTPFMVMELLEGETLARRMSHPPPMTVGETVRVVARLLSGLGAVHDAGIVHRDLKPENVFLVRDADGVLPKLIDFGVSRALDTRAGVESVLPTMENAIAGTPQYMSPEQARGLADVDYRSDLWSAGIVLFELLTGRLPYDGDAAGDVIIQIATADPPDFGMLRPDLRGPLEAFVKRSMAKDPAARFQSARAMRAALLAAVRSTASQLGVASSREELATADDVTQAALLEAVGASYEPGDSGLIDVTSQLDVLESLFPPPGPALDGPPPAPPDADDPFAAADGLDPQPARRSPQAKTWLLLAGVVLVVLLAAAVVVVALAPPSRPDIQVTELGVRPTPEPTGLAPAPPAPADRGPVRVTLDAVPEGAEIRLDGEAWAGGSPVELPRDGRSHVVEVRARDGRSYRVEHVADADASYRVELPAQLPRPATRGRPSSRRRQGSEETPEGGGHLIRSPGF